MNKPMTREFISTNGRWGLVLQLPPGVDPQSGVQSFAHTRFAHAGRANGRSYYRCVDSDDDVIAIVGEDLTIRPGEAPDWIDPTVTRPGGPLVGSENLQSGRSVTLLHARPGDRVRVYGYKRRSVRDFAVTADGLRPWSPLDVEVAR